MLSSLLFCPSECDRIWTGAQIMAPEHTRQAVFSECLSLAPSPDPTYSVIRNKGKINPKDVCVRSMMNESKSISLGFYWIQSLNRSNH